MQNLIFSIFPNQNFVDLGLFQFGWERCTPAHSFGPAARNHYLFHYILSGTGTLMADDSKGVTQTYSIKSMQGFMIFPNQITTYVADKQLPWEYVWLEFDGLRVKSLLDTIGLSLDKPVYHARNKSLRVLNVFVNFEQFKEDYEEFRNWLIDIKTKGGHAVCHIFRMI